MLLDGAQASRIASNTLLLTVLLVVAVVMLSCRGGGDGSLEEIAHTVKDFAVAFANGDVAKLDSTLWSKACSADEVTKADATASATARSLDGEYGLSIDSNRLSIVMVDEQHVEVPLDQAEGVFRATVGGEVDSRLVLIGDTLPLVREDGRWRVDCTRVLG